MTVYEELIDLKYRKGVSTIKLLRRYPEHRKRVHEVALLGVPERTLRNIVKEKKFLNKLLEIKKKFYLKTMRAKASESKKPWFIWW